MHKILIILFKLAMMETNSYLYLKIHLFILNICIYVCPCVHVRGNRFTGSGETGVCKLPEVNAGSELRSLARGYVLLKAEQPL